MTKLETERKVKKAVGKLAEQIEATGQEADTKATKWVQELSEEETRVHQQQVATTLSLLEEKAKFKFKDYKRTLAQVMDQLADTEQFPAGWRYHIAVTDKGLVMVLLSPAKRRFARAFTPSNIPKFDFVAMEKIMESAWVAINTNREETTLWTP